MLANDSLHETLELVGNPGVGKTALSVAMGTKARETERTVAFSNVPNLVIEMKEAMGLNQLTAYKKGFERFDLVILSKPSATDRSTANAARCCSTCCPAATGRARR